MRFKPTTCSPRAARPAGFTLAEVLAALLFMAIVIPVTVEGVRIASRVGQVGERKAAAARVADRILNELLVTGQVQTGAQSGRLEEGNREYAWTMLSEPWTADAMNLVTVSVRFTVQGQDFSVALSTLYNPNAAATGTTTTTQ
jgi:type II secretory pathway pseudopilin PulG